MPRSARVAPGDMVFHCLNRGNDRRELFFDDVDYAAFERVLESALEAVPVRLLALLSDAEPLAPGAVAAAGRRTGPVHAAADNDARPPMPYARACAFFRAALIVLPRAICPVFIPQVALMQRFQGDDRFGVIRIPAFAWALNSMRRRPTFAFRC